MKDKKKFTWVPVYKEIVRYLTGMKERQFELIDLLKNIGVTGFKDYDETGEIELDEIDPLTFFSYLNKYGPKKRIALLQMLAKEIGATVEVEDDFGLPSSQAQQVWFFPFKKDRLNGEIDRLWQFFFDAVEHKISDDQFEDILTIISIGKAKLTEAMFYIDPENYLPIDSPVKYYFENELGIDSSFSSFTEYKSLLDTVKTKKSLPFYEISYESWKMVEEKPSVKKSKPIIQPETGKRYWLYAPGSQASRWDEFYNLGIMAIGWDKLGDLNQYKSKTEIAEKLQDLSEESGSKKNNATANYDFRSRIAIGDIIIVKKGRSELLGYGTVSSEYYFDESRERYKHCRKVDWKKKGSWQVDGSLALKTLTDITPYHSDNPDYEFYFETLMSIMEGDTDLQPEFPLNLIVYGPPGTGKTYNSIKKAAEILEKRVIDDYDEALDIFNRNLGGRIRFITFHQNYSYEDFIQGLRPDIGKNSTLRFERRDGIFTMAAVDALFEYYREYKKLEHHEDGDSVLNAREVYLDYIENLKTNDAREFDTISGSTIILDNINENNNLEFRHKERSRSYLVSSTRLLKLYDAYPDISMIGNINNDIREVIGGCNATAYWVALKDFIAFYNKHKTVTTDSLQSELDEISYEDKKQLLSTIELQELRKVTADSVDKYVIIIDEINRANISRVFGELITLIERDKRSHGKIPLKTLLPSGEEFIVPSNLYIVGTMNTADKSIALLDIALRRRFHFEPMYPLYEIEGTEIFDADILQRINSQIIEKKGYDFQIGHSYFMGDDIDIIDRMNNYVIPLLLEYFMNDESEVKNILVNAGLQIKPSEWPLSVAGIND